MRPKPITIISTQIARSVAVEDLDCPATAGRGTPCGSLKEIKRQVDEGWRELCRRRGALYSSRHASIRLECL